MRKVYYIADQKEALIQGDRGATVDAAVHYVDWGFRLQDIPGKVHVSTARRIASCR